MEILGCEAARKLNCWKDFADSQPIVWQVFKTSPILLALTLITSGLDVLELPKAAERGLQMAEGFLMLACMMRVVNETWASITGEQRCDPRRDFDRFVSAWGSSIYYSLCAILGTLLFIGPGVYWMVIASLGLPFVCIDKMRAGPAIDASLKLMRGNFREAAGYLMPAFFAIGVGIFLSGYAVIFGIEFTIGMMQPENAPVSDQLSIPSMILNFALMVWVSWVLMCQMSMQTRLFHYLKQKQAAAVVQPAVG